MPEVNSSWPCRVPSCTWAAPPTWPPASQLLRPRPHQDGQDEDELDGLEGRDERLAKVEVAVLGVLLVLTVLGNAVVLLALYARRRCGGRRKLSRMFYFILHLSVADMVTAFFSVLPQLVWKVTFRFHGGNFLCKAVKFGQPLGVYLSSYVLTATACDRYRAICHPLTYCSWTSRRAKTMVWAAWGVAICFSAPQAFIFSYRQVGPGETDCWADFPPDWGVRSYVTWYACSVFVVPLVVLFFTYSRITCEIWRCASTRHVPSALPAAAVTPGATPAATPSAGRARIALSCQQAHAYAYRFGAAQLAGSPPSPAGTASPGTPSMAAAGSLLLTTATTTNTSTTGSAGSGRGGGACSAGSFVAVRSASSRTNPLISRAKINTVKQSVLVIMLYIVCSGPFICAQLWAAWTTPGDGASNAVREDAEYLQDSSNVYTILTLLFSLNSCVNPWIYLAFNKELRSPLFLLLSCRACKQAAIGRGQSAAAGSMHSSCSSVNNGHVAAPATAAPGAVGRRGHRGVARRAPAACKTYRLAPLPRPAKSRPRLWPRRLHWLCAQGQQPARTSGGPEKAPAESASLQLSSPANNHVGSLEGSACSPICVVAAAAAANGPQVEVHR